MDEKRLKTEYINIDEIKLNERNYKEHPDDQIEHIMESIRENGIYVKFPFSSQF